MAARVAADHLLSVCTNEPFRPRPGARAEIDSPTYDANYFDPRGEQDLYFPVTAPYLKLAAVQGHNEVVTLFALNRHLTERCR